ncbi:MAG: hypothetical protein JO189_14725 [Deltaproteobacteria bacterium]|nr:hypothetical protein [Deltaproteobacteria bacterium]
MLPPNIRKEVERRMLAKRFSDYEGLAEWVRQQGYDNPDKEFSCRDCKRIS